MKRFLVLTGTTGGRRRLAVGALILPLIIMAAGTARAGGTSGPSVTTTPPSGSFAISGPRAAAFHLPSDLRELWTSTLPDGGTQTRYQQVVAGADVYGGQVSVLRNKAGGATAVIGAYFRGLTAENSVKLSARAARQSVKASLGGSGAWSTRLRLDPRSGQFFYEIGSIRSDSRPVRWINAGTGATMRAYDAMADGEGVGVHGDTKPVDSTPTANGFTLVSSDGRVKTLDAGNKSVIPGGLATDADDLWDSTTPQFRSPDQRVEVDAHYNAAVVADFYRDVFVRNSLDDRGMQIVLNVHYGNQYCNANWNGESVQIGDGYTGHPSSGSYHFTCGPPVSLDVLGHELTHGVTEFTSGLGGNDEADALNESFSDMMAMSIEFWAAANGRATGTPDWLLGEDFFTDGTGAAGWRNIANPVTNGGDYDHYSEFVTNGNPHVNGGISNVAFYLATEGGHNPGCAPPYSTHTADCGVAATGLGIEAAERIFYNAFTSLPEYANMCDARNATTALNPTVESAWDAVGIHEGCTPGLAPPTPCVGSAAATLPFGPPSPYNPRSDCTWTVHNGSGGFAFHFSGLDLEDGFDFARVIDGNGNVLATYTGRIRHGFTTPCIATSVGSVQFTSDGNTQGAGFTVDGTTVC